jgi:hypothetical protein
MFFKKITILIFSSILISQGSIFNSNEILSETKLHAIPSNMTFEEYKDMNRRISLGLMLSAIPIPGAIHQYAGEPKISRRLRVLGVVGFGLLVAGASMQGDDLNDKDSNSYSRLTDGGIDYYKIPVYSASTTVDGVTSTELKYKLMKVEEKKTGNKSIQLLGACILIANFAYDYYFGIKAIEDKRDRVRYKYGKSIDFGLKPQFNLNDETYSATLYFNF